MISDGIWVLAMVLAIGENQVIVVPYEIFDNMQVCIAWRDREARDNGVLMTCYKHIQDEI